MEPKHLFSSEEKLKWFGYGEWVEEPDFIAFLHCNLKCKIQRIVKWEPNGVAFGGYWCGYCKIPEDSIIDFIDSFYLQLEEEPHGGITYKNQEEDGYWIGFDCAHSGDLVPSIEMLNKTIPELIKINQEREEFRKKCSSKLAWMFENHYRNMNYVLGETKLLAEQINLYNSKLLNNDAST